MLVDTIEMARNLLQQEPGRVDSHAFAADTQIITVNKAVRHIGRAKYAVKKTDGKTFTVTFTGRERWALDQLRHAGATGCTPFLNPAHRWAAYAYCLRKKGMEIETIIEPHAGDFPGRHARYVLQSRAFPFKKGGAV